MLAPISELPSIIGSFTEKMFGNHFEFSNNTDDIYKQFPHKIWVTEPKEGIDSGFRYGKVLKTKVYILIDENVDEFWRIKKYKLYPRDEV